MSPSVEPKIPSPLGDRLDLYLRQRVRKLAVYGQFSVVGVGNAIVDLGTLNLLLWLWPSADPGMLALYNTGAMLLANANSYFWNTAWTFRRQARRTKLLRKRVGFATQAVLNIGVNDSVFWLAIGWLASTPLPAVVGQNVAKVISTLVASALSFIVLRYVVLKPRRKLGRADTIDD